MAAEALTLYPPCEVVAPDMPARSRLYRLEPVGVGTPYVECLTGYVARLAEAHGVTTAVLFGWELVPLIAEKWLKGEKANRAMLLASRFRPVARAMNGTGVTAADWVRVVGSATTRKELRHLTMLAWGGVLSQRHLLRPVRAWCPACYQGWRERDETVYEPLLWAIDAVKVCSIHRRPLRTRCDSCDRQLFHLASHSRPGFCPACRSWLGASPGTRQSSDETLTDAEFQRQERVANAVGELLAAAPRLARLPEKHVIARSTALCVERATPGGTILAFSRMYSIRKQTVGNWWRGDSIPSLDSLLPFCFSAGVSLLDYLTGRLEARPLGERPATTEKRDTRLWDGVARRRRNIDRTVDGRVLRAALRENPPRSMVGIAREMDRQPNTLKYQFPDLCKAIVARYMEHLRRSKVEEWGVAKRALEASLVDESHPCVAQVARRIGWNCVRLRRRFPELCRLVTARHADSQREEWLGVENALKAVLKEEPPPSLVEIVARLGRCEASLYFRFPTLCRRIAARHMEFRKQSFVRRRGAFAAEVRAVALNIFAEGIYPSVKRVQSGLPSAKSLRSSKSGLEALRRVREELELDSRAGSATRF